MTSQMPEVDEEKPPGTEDDPEIEGSAPDPAAAAIAAAQVIPLLDLSVPRRAVHPSLASNMILPASKSPSHQPCIVSTKGICCEVARPTRAYLCPMLLGFCMLWSVSRLVMNCQYIPDGCCSLCMQAYGYDYGAYGYTGYYDPSDPYAGYYAVAYAGQYDPNAAYASGTSLRGLRY